LVKALAEENRVCFPAQENHRFEVLAANRIKSSSSLAWLNDFTLADVFSNQRTRGLSLKPTMSHEPLTEPQVELASCIAAIPCRSSKHMQLVKLGNSDISQKLGESFQTGPIVGIVFLKPELSLSTSRGFQRRRSGPIHLVDEC